MSRLRRVVIWRYDLLVTSIAVLFPAGVVVGWVTGLVEPPGWTFGSVVVGYLLAFYLLGPSAHVRVRASDVLVANTFARTRIPREAIREVTGWEWDEVVIYLLDGRRIRVGALSSSITASTPPHYRRKAKRLERALRDVPAVAAGGAVRRRIRYEHVLLALLTPAALGAPLVWGL